MNSILDLKRTYVPPKEIINTKDARDRPQTKMLLVYVITAIFLLHFYKYIGLFIKLGPYGKSNILTNPQLDTENWGDLP